MTLSGRESGNEPFPKMEVAGMVRPLVVVDCEGWAPSFFDCRWPPFLMLHAMQGVPAVIRGMVLTVPGSMGRSSRSHLLQGCFSHGVCTCHPAWSIYGLIPACERGDACRPFVTDRQAPEYDALFAVLPFPGTRTISLSGPASSRSALRPCPARGSIASIPLPGRNAMDMMRPQ